MKKQILFILVLVMAVAYGAYFSWFTITRHAKLNSTRFDLGNVEQVLWNSTHGHLFTMTDPYGVATVSRFNFHADIFLVLLAPIYAIFPYTQTILLLQTLFVASGGIATWLLARKYLGGVWGVIFTAMYFMNPAIQFANIFDAHAVTFATPLILWTIWLATVRHYRWMAVCALLALTTKEEIGFMLAAIGVFILLSKGSKHWGKLMLAGPLLWSLIMMLVVLPSFQQTQTDTQIYRSRFGSSTVSIAGGVLHHPVQTVRILLAQPNLVYGWELIRSWGFTPLLSPWTVAAGPEYVINALSDKPAQHLTISQYTSGITPWLAAGSIFGLAYARKRIQKRPWPKVPWMREAALMIVVIGGAAYSAWAAGPLSFEKRDQTPFVNWSSPYAKSVRHWEQTVPTTALVSATNSVGAHFARRQDLFSFPLGVELSDYVVVLEHHSTPIVATDAEVSDDIAKLRADPAWTVLQQTGDLTVLKRVHPATKSMRL